MTKIDIGHLAGWIGACESGTDRISTAAVARLAALLDHPVLPPGTAVPPLGHWLAFTPTTRQALLAADGHPLRGGLLPPVALPRRMWAGGSIEFAHALALDAPLERRTTVTGVRHRQGNSGDLVFVTLRHEIRDGDGLALTETQELVYRDRGAAIAAPVPRPAPTRHRTADARRTVLLDPVLLFRYAALTFNAHRIHYDRDHARDVEGYPGLVVQAPLLATLLVDVFARSAPGRRISRLSFRANRPIFDGAPIDLCLAWRDGGADLWARTGTDDCAFEAGVDAD